MAVLTLISLLVPLWLPTRGEPTVTAAVGAERCCWPRQWEASVNQELGTYSSDTSYASLAELDTQLHVDLDAGKIAADILVNNVTSKSTTLMRVIEDYPRVGP
ncbi:hypothetical protein PoB_000275100 [Plakobranchus ocellatus]|uniref:Uncharacterized protein n=1 Tax=Plakobranchus ocellatus TaxID=259542 RepID=A0AAV3XZJ2_9GAST|nr:hypothetical protein PoB_000275100 [Plakobranchus ocellatus]